MQHPWEKEAGTFGHFASLFTLFCTMMVVVTNHQFLNPTFLFVVYESVSIFQEKELLDFSIFNALTAVELKASKLPNILMIECYIYLCVPYALI